MSDYSNHILNLLAPLMMGLGLGAIFFYGLWRTTKKATNSRFMALWLFGSAILRFSMTLAGFYFVADINSGGQLKNMLVCLLGFSMARFAITKLIQVRPKLASLEEGPRHAP